MDWLTLWFAIELGLIPSAQIVPSDANGNFWPRNPDSFSELMRERQGKKPRIQDPVLRAKLDFDEEPEPAEKPKDKAKKPGPFDGPAEETEKEYIF